jgi:hypothetical protein
MADLSSTVNLSLLITIASADTLSIITLTSRYIACKYAYYKVDVDRYQSNIDNGYNV